MIRHEDIDDGPLTSKLHKVCCVPCIFPCNFLFRSCRNAVSGNKRRYIGDGYDLDLTYVTDRIIVHGFPAHGLEHVYRNPRYELQRFLDERHAEHYKMFNFCCEPGRGYDPAIFHNRVERYPFKDHNTPPLETMFAFANSAKEWLDADPKNVINMHCKAGKGRAGLMCCVSLIRTGTAPSAAAALDLYDAQRVTNKRGLTVTSQRKYVMFYEAIWRQCWGVTGNIGAVSAEEERRFKVPVQPKAQVSGIEIVNLPESMIHGFSISVYKLSNFSPEKLYSSGLRRSRRVNVNHVGVELQGNFKIIVTYKDSLFGGEKKLMELQHNTFFMDCGASCVDFGLDQLDLKRRMKTELSTAGANGKGDVVLRLKLGARELGSSVENKGYYMLSTEDPEVLGVEMNTRSSKSVSRQNSSASLNSQNASVLLGVTTLDNSPSRSNSSTRFPSQIERTNSSASRRAESPSRSSHRSESPSRSKPVKLHSINISTSRSSSPRRQH